MKRVQAPLWKRWVRVALWPLMPGWPDEARRVVQGPRLRSLIDRVDREANAPLVRILNAGAGEGAFSRLLLRIPRAAAIVELDPFYQSRVRIPIDARQQVVSGSLTDIALGDASIDFVLCTEVLEHIPDDAQAVRELRRVLAPGGWLLITVPTPPAVYDPDHVREGYTAEALSAMLTACGFEIVAIDYCMHAAFRAIMRLYRRLGRWLTKAPLWTLALFDRFCPLGTPMDLMMLARVPAAIGQLAGRDRAAGETAARVA